MGNKIALLIDFDNVILGVDDPGFDVEIVVNALRSRGNVVMGRAYGDWYRHHRHRRKLMEQGIELVETPVFGPLIKNSADIRIVLDGFEIAMSQPHINTFCLVSGDSDFLPLIKKLQYLGKHVIVIAGIKFTSDLIRRNCNEYISYENLFAESVGATEDVSTIEGAYVLLERAINTLNERIMDVRSSSVKQMMMQLNPAFSERTFGCSQFKQFLERAARDNRVTLEARDGSAGEMSVYWRDDAPRPEVKALPPSVTRASIHALRNPDRQAERQSDRQVERPARDLSTARRSGRKFSGRAGGVQNEATAPAASGGEAEVPAQDVPIMMDDVILNDTAADATPAPRPLPTADALSEDEFAAAVAPAGGFVNKLAKRSDLRPGRLRFSAKTGTTPARVSDGAPSPTPAEIEQASEAELAVTYPATGEETAPVQPAASTQQSEDAAAAAEAFEAAALNAPKKRATRRGGRTRKKKDEETAEASGSEPAAAAESTPAPAVEAAPETAAPVAAQAPAPARTASGRGRKAQPAPPEVPAPQPSSDTDSLFPIGQPASESNPEPAEAAAEAAAETAPKKPTRARRGGTKRTTAKKKAEGGEAGESA